MPRHSIVMRKIGRPIPADAPFWYPAFWELATGDDLLTALEQNMVAVEQTLSKITPRQIDMRYASSKWTLKQLLIHLADEERYYGYKAFCCSRGSMAFLEAPMSEGYCNGFNSENRSLADITAELRAVRKSTITLFQTMTTAMLDLRSDQQTERYTARSLGWFTAGHSYHHLNIIHQKYMSL